MRWPFLLTILLVVAGCAAPPEKEEVAAPPPPKLANIGEISFESSSKAVLLNDAGGEVAVGTEFEDVRKVFPREKAKAFSSLPPTLDPEKFDVWGWEDKSRGSFGVIMDKTTRQAVLAMRTFKDIGENELAFLVGRYEEALAAKKDRPDVLGQAGKYYFWEDGPERVMICAVTNTHGGYNVAVAMGEKQVMNAIDASPEAAETGLKKAETFLAKSTSTQPGR